MGVVIAMFPNAKHALRVTIISCIYLCIRGWHVSSKDTIQWLFTDFELLEMKIVVFVACLLLSVNEPSVIRSGQFRNSVSLLTKYKWSAMSLSSEGDLCNPRELNDLGDFGDNVNDGFNEFFFVNYCWAFWGWSSFIARVKWLPAAFVNTYEDL